MAQEEANTPPDPVELIQMEDMKLDLETKAAGIDFTVSQTLQAEAQVAATLAKAEKDEMSAVTDLMNAMTKSFAAGMAEMKESQELLQDQILESQNNYTDQIGPQIQQAFERLEVGSYADENGNIYQVKEDGSISPEYQMQKEAAEAQQAQQEQMAQQQQQGQQMPPQGMPPGAQ